MFYDKMNIYFNVNGSWNVGAYGFGTIDPSPLIRDNNPSQSGSDDPGRWFKTKVKA